MGRQPLGLVRVVSEGAMTHQLQDIAASARAKGHEYVQLVIVRQNSPRDWTRAQIRPGLFGKCIGATGRYPGEWLFDVRVDAIEAWLERRKK